jgi:hypothetical protein
MHDTIRDALNPYSRLFIFSVCPSLCLSFLPNGANLLLAVLLVIVAPKRRRPIVIDSMSEKFAQVFMLEFFSTLFL